MSARAIEHIPTLDILQALIQNIEINRLRRIEIVFISVGYCVLLGGELFVERVLVTNY